MTDDCRLVRPCITDIPPYRPGKPIAETAREYGLRPEQVIKLASNENPLGMSEAAREAARQAVLGEAWRYPDAAARELRQALADHFGLSHEWVIMGNGSDEILSLAARLTLTPEAGCVYARHSFSVYEIVARESGASRVVIPLHDWAIDLEAMAAACDDRTRLVFLTNPNNPTGLALRPELVAEFLEQVPAHVLVVLDEAYWHYLPPESRSDPVPWLRRYPNLLVTRTFSKAYGLAGLRVGCGLAQPELIALLQRIRPPFNLNAVAQAAALAALGDSEFLSRVHDFNRRGLAQLQSGLAERGFRTLPSQANFVCFRVGPAAAELHRELLRRGVVIRPLEGFGLADWMRVSVGTGEQNRRFLSALDEIVAAGRPVLERLAREER